MRMNRAHTSTATIIRWFMHRMPLLLLFSIFSSLFSITVSRFPRPHQPAIATIFKWSIDVCLHGEQYRINWCCVEFSMKKSCFMYASILFEKKSIKIGIHYLQMLCGARTSFFSLRTKNILEPHRLTVTYTRTYSQTHAPTHICMRVHFIHRNGDGLIDQMRGRVRTIVLWFCGDAQKAREEIIGNSALTLTRSNGISVEFDRTTCCRTCANHLRQPAW